MKVAFALPLLAFLSGVASAQGITATDQGWYRSDGQHSMANMNYLVGQCCGDGDRRSFFSFDISEIQHEILAAALVLPQPESGFSSVNRREILELYDVHTDFSKLWLGSAGIAGYEDLGSGNSYGRARVRTGSNGSLVTIQLGEEAIDDLNAGTGAYFTVGAVLTTLDGSSATREYSFGLTGAHRARLLVDVDDSTAQTVLVIGGNPGMSAFETTNATFPTQLDSVEDFAFPAQDSLPSFPLPEAVDAIDPVLIPEDPSDGPYNRFPATPVWMGDRSFSVQVLINDPINFPDAPLRWSEGLHVSIRPDGGIVATPFGVANSVGILMEVFVDGEGQRRVRFPYALAISSPAEGDFHQVSPAERIGGR